MITRKQKIIYASAGGAAVSSLIWLRYGKSAGGAREFLGGTGAKVMRTLRRIHGVMDTIQKRSEEIDRLVEEMIDLGRIEKSQVEAVIGNSLQRYEETAELIRQNLTQSSDDVTALLSHLKDGVKHLSLKPHTSKAA
jgi:signal transduction histidine kinase